MTTFYIFAALGVGTILFYRLFKWMDAYDERDKQKVKRWPKDVTKF